MTTSNLKQNVVASKIVFVKNLNYTVSSEEMYSLFGQFGAIRQIRVGNDPDTKGTAFVVYEDNVDAKMACNKLNGYNFGGRYLITLLHNPDRGAKQEYANVEKMES